MTRAPRASRRLGAAEQEADAGAVDAGRIGAGCLGDDDAGFTGRGVRARPSSSPRRRMLMEAVRSDWPRTSGMATCCAPRLSVTRTAHWRRTVTPGAGDWARTWPGGVLGE